MPCFPWAGPVTPTSPLPPSEWGTPIPTGDGTGAASGSAAHCGRPPTAVQPAQSLPREQCSWELHHRELTSWRKNKYASKEMNIIASTVCIDKNSTGKAQMQEACCRHYLGGGGLALGRSELHPLSPTKTQPACLHHGPSKEHA